MADLEVVEWAGLDLEDMEVGNSMQILKKKG